MNILALAAIFVLGTGIAQCALPRRNTAEAILFVFISILIGLGFFSIVYTISEIAGAGNALRWIDVALIAVGILFFAFCKSAESKGVIEKSSVSHLPVLILIALIIGACIAMAFRFIESPDGDWDAWWIWNLMARFMYRDPGHIARAFDPALYHPDYPPLLPGMIAHLWWAVGRETVLVPIGLAVFFTASAVSIVGAALAMLRNARVGMIAAMVLLGSPAVLDLGASQYADLPIACYFTGAIAICALVEGGKLSPRAIWIAGLLAAFTACVKNDGIAMIVAIVVALLIFQPKLIGYFIIGAAAPLVLLVIFKMKLAPPNDLVTGSTDASVSSKLFDPHRYVQIVEAIVHHIIDWRRWGIFLIGAIVLLIVQIVRRKLDRVAWMVCAMIGALINEYFFIYVVTPHDLTWHLQTSLERLMVQVYFGLVLAALCAGEGMPRTEVRGPVN